MRLAAFWRELGERLMEGPLSPTLRWSQREVLRIELSECQPVWRAGGVKLRMAWLTVL
jgi:hypothetical protein